MELTIQYARTEDGVSIAFTTVGVGPPVLCCPNQFVSMRHMLSGGVPALIGGWYEQQTERTRFTIFDHAGVGASQREVTDFSVGAQLRAVEAVAAQLPDDSLTVEGFGAGCVSAALYATRHADRVSKLVCLYPTPSSCTPRFAEILREDWSLGRRRIAAWAYPDSIVTQRWCGNAMRESMTAEATAAYITEYHRAELSKIFGAIPVPTLVCVTGSGQDSNDALALASVVGDCRVAIAGLEAVGDAILDFIGLDPGPVQPASERPAMAVVLFIDIADSTALTERLGDAVFRVASRALDDRVRAAMREHAGTVVDGKVLGDGVMGVFSSAAQAIAAARACLVASAELPLHIGLHAGDVIREKANVYGGAVNIASRICGLCEPGEILVSATIRELARTSAGVVFEDRGEKTLKGIDDAVRVFAVRQESG